MGSTPPVVVSFRHSPQVYFGSGSIIRICNIAYLCHFA